jgi:release factor glutamine methyltransferase
MPEASIAMLLKGAARELAATSDTPSLDAEVLLAHALDTPRGHLFAWPERVPSACCIRHFEELIARRAGGQPVAYLIGRKEFWALDLTVTPATLIPRPDTELLVELALAQAPLQPPAWIADLGTGSGAIALAIARERPEAYLVATDISAEALAVATLNAQRLNIGNVRFRQGSWCHALGSQRFDLIVSNPPYVAASDPHLNQGDPRFEPRRALVADEDGLQAIRRIVSRAKAHLRPGGRLLLEHGFDQSERVMALYHRHGFNAVANHRDLAGILRVTEGRGD